MFTKEAITQLQEGAAIVAASGALYAAKENDFLAALPSDYKLHDLEAQQPLRRRARGTMFTESKAAFAAYTSAHAEAGATVFVDADTMQAQARLNLGTPTAPGHADNTASYNPAKSAAYIALRAHTSGPLKQAQLAEFVEDWAECIQCFDGAAPITPVQAVAALRKITIEALRKIETSEQQLSASKSSFESVTATSDVALPTHIYFKCAPYADLAERTFVMRLGINTGSDKPLMSLRIIQTEKHTEEMAAELVSIVAGLFDGKLPVVAGTYNPAK